MDMSAHTINNLFKQLGLPATDADIERFIAQHPLSEYAGPLHEAPCWTPTQAAFLKQSIADDADWAPVVDQLSARLRH